MLKITITAVDSISSVINYHGEFNGSVILYIELLVLALLIVLISILNVKRKAYIQEVSNNMNIPLLIKDKKYDPNFLNDLSKYLVSLLYYFKISKVEIENGTYNLLTKASGDLSVEAIKLNEYIKILMIWLKYERGEIKVFRISTPVYSIINEVFESNKILLTQKNISVNIIKNEDVIISTDLKLIKFILQQIINFYALTCKIHDNISIYTVNKGSQVSIRIQPLDTPSVFSNGLFFKADLVAEKIESQVSSNYQQILLEGFKFCEIISELTEAKILYYSKDELSFFELIFDDELKKT